MGATIQIRRGTAAQWAAAPVPLAEGEPGIATDTNILKIGDGTSLLAALPAVAWNPEISALTMVAGTDPGASAASIPRCSRCWRATRSACSPHQGTPQRRQCSGLTLRRRQ